MVRGCIIAAVCVTALLIVGMGVAAWFIFHTVKPRNVSLRDFARMADTEAKTFARGRRDVDCVDEAMRRAEAAPDMTGQARVSMFLRSCIEAARDPDCARACRADSSA